MERMPIVALKPGTAKIKENATAAVLNLFLKEQWSEGEKIA